MTKRSIPTLLSALLVAAPAVAAARVVVVDDDGADCPRPDASSIDVGVLLANPGDTIRVCLGEYGGGVVVDKAGVRIKAQGPLGSVRVVGTGPGGPRFGFAIRARGVGIEGFDIARFDGQPDGAGIVVGDTALAPSANGAVIANNDIHDNANGIWLWQSNGARIEYNRVHHQRLSGGGGGTGIVSLAGLDDAQVAAANAAGQSGRDHEIRTNLVYQNERRGILVGACADARLRCEGPLGVLADLRGMVVEHNEVFENGDGGFEGIGVRHARGGMVRQNWVHDNAFDGILVASAQGTTVWGNRVAKNSAARRGFAGIGILGSARVTVQKNQTDDNETGIRVSLSTEGVFTKNAADHNAVLDMEWDGRGTHTFARNRCDVERVSTTALGCR